VLSNFVCDWENRSVSERSEQLGCFANINAFQCLVDFLKGVGYSFKFTRASDQSRFRN
jgi:hypothetical protein